MVLALTLVLGSAWAYPKDHITEKSWFEDTTGLMTWDEASLLNGIQN